VRRGEIGDLYIEGRALDLMYWGNQAPVGGNIPGAWTKTGDKYKSRRGWQYVYDGRSDDMLGERPDVSTFEVGSTLPGIRRARGRRDRTTDEKRTSRAPSVRRI